MVNVEIWQPTIIEQLFKSNEFLKFAHNADEYVIGARIVHIPQSGGAGGAQRNRAILPAVVVRRNDTDIVYASDEYTTDPKLITNSETVELSYNKRASVVREETAGMMEMVGDDMLYNWAENLPSTQIIGTSGAGSVGTAPGATGDRKILVEQDLRKIQTQMNLQNVPKANRYAVLTSNQIDQLMTPDNVKMFTQPVINLPEGVITKLYGFNIIERSSVLRLDGIGGIKLPESASATDDDEAGMLFQMDSVERAIGEINMFDKNGEPTYYGDIFSFLVRAKGRRRRADNKGVFLLRNVAA